MNRKQIQRTAVILVCLAIVGWIGRRTFQSKPVPVQVAEAARGIVESSVSNTKAGTVEARRRASLAPQVGGLVAVIAKRKGDRVDQGEVILRLDDAAQRADLALAQRSLDSAIASLDRACLVAERARQEYDRQRRLGEKSILSVDVVEEAKNLQDLALAGCKVAEAEIARAQATVDVAQAALDKTVVRAPFAGIIAEMKVEEGEWITPAPPLIQIPTLIDLIGTSELYVSAPMDEVDSSRIRLGQAAKVSLDPYPGRTWTAHVKRVAPYVLDVESQNRTVEIEVELDDVPSAAGLLPGTSADVEVVLEVRPDVLRIPTSAVMEGGHVLVLEDGELVRKAVVTGLRNWEFTEVVSGLSEGERVVVSLERAEVTAGAAAVAQAPTVRP